MKRIHKMMVLFLAIAISISAMLYAADVVQRDMELSLYPEMFISNDRLDVTFVVGEYAKSDDVLSTVDIAISLQDMLKEMLENEEGNNVFELDITGNPQDELTDMYMDVFNKKKESAANTVLDTSLNNESILDKNFIVVGGPCVNWVAAHFMGNPERCTDDFLAGRGYFRLYRNGKGIVMVVAGFTADDTKTAAQVLAHYEDYSSNFVGTSMRVSSAWMSELRIE